ncbi:polyprenyl synthetase family protein [Candidatus Roizmanbacteria bacterium]|nr:polyprenyl synthetase family protein [Candidatus Roizmanbacteria bacterium]
MTQLLFKQKLNTFLLEFEPRLENYFENKIEERKNDTEASQYVLKEIQRITLSGGKRLRPALVYFGYLLGEKQVEEELFSIGIALELFHAYLLIHDDIMDQAETRRGIPTIESIYKQKFQSLSNKDHLAVTGAILAGDYASMLAHEIISTIPLSPSIKTLLLNLFFAMQHEVVSGQIDDCLGVGIEDFDHISEENIVTMLKNKSGRYSIEKPLLIGATLAEVSPKKLNLLHQLGDDLGLLFQIVDDMIGIFGDEKKTGKPSNSDIFEGKRTLLMFYTYQCASENERLRMKQILGNRAASAKDVIWLKGFIQEKGIDTKLKTYTEDLEEKTQALLRDHFEPTNQGVPFLSHLATYLLKREQ